MIRRVVFGGLFGAFIVVGALWIIGDPSQKLDDEKTDSQTEPISVPVRTPAEVVLNVRSAVEYRAADGLVIAIENGAVHGTDTLTLRRRLHNPTRVPVPGEIVSLTPVTGTLSKPISITLPIAPARLGAGATENVIPVILTGSDWQPVQGTVAGNGATVTFQTDRLSTYSWNVKQ